MGIDSRRPPLPAPTESMGETSGAETEVATNVTTRTDKTSYSIPEDGRPITISTQKITSDREGGLRGHHRQKSQTSLLIEYFESAKTGDKVRNRPSVRVKVTPSSTKRSRGIGAHDAIQITGIGKDRKPSYTRRISLGSSKNAEIDRLAPTEGTEISFSSGSGLSNRPPIEIEVMGHGSEISAKSARGLLYANDSNVSSMPPDSMLEGSDFTESELSRDYVHDDETTPTKADHLTAPIGSRSRSASRERITQKVMEKLAQTTSKSRKSGKSHSERSTSKEHDADGYPRERRRRSSKSHNDEETVSGAESSLLSSQLAPSQRSYRTTTSQGSRMTNNPKLLEMVEDTIKRMILPEINAIKETQKTDRNIQSFESSRASLPRDGYESSGLERRVSKSSSTPNIASKPKVVLNRDGDDPGVVLSRGDSERRKVRKSSGERITEVRPSSRHSSGRPDRQGDGFDDESAVRHKSSRSGHGLRDAAAAGVAGGILTAAALQHHDSQRYDHERRKKHSKSRSSRSRSTSVTEHVEESFSRKDNIPPMPMASHINDSEMTRDSIVSTTSTERPNSRGSGDVRTPIREVSRTLTGDAMSPISSRSRTPVSNSRGLGMSHNNQSIASPRSSRSPISANARVAALAAAGLGGAALVKTAEYQHESHMNTDGYGSPVAQRSLASPVQSVSSLKKQFEDEDPLVPQGLRPKSAASRSSAGNVHKSEASLRSSPITQRLAQSRKHSQYDSDEVGTPLVFATPLERPDASFMRDGTSTPTGGEDVDDWYERQHEVNDRYRDSFGEATNHDSFGEATNRDSYQTNPYPEDDRRFTTYTDDSFDGGNELAQHVRPIGANPDFVHSPMGVESNVASLMDPSFVSSNMLSSESSIPKYNGASFAHRMADHQRNSKDSNGIFEGSASNQSQPSQDRWAAIKGHAREISGSRSEEHIDDLASPRQSPAKSLRDQHSTASIPVMGLSGLPVAHDPIPEIGHFDDSKSDLTTNPSIVEGPLGGDASGKETWPYSPEPREQVQQQLIGRDSSSLRSVRTDKGEIMMAAAGGAAALAGAHSARHATVHDEEDYREDREIVESRRHTETTSRDVKHTSPVAFRDEGYVTDGHTRSAGATTPHMRQQKYGKNDVEEFNRAMDSQDLGDDDPFTSDSQKHARHLSGNSHGMASPLYDSATGTGLDRIQSKDVVALMDHLTVRDAQRNARDTEILVTLVRSAAEMRQSFDDMKRFIAEQDDMIMQNTDRDAEVTVQKIVAVGGPRPQPPASPRTISQRESQDEIQTKRKNVLRRALKGLTGGKKADDLAKIEEMLNHILYEVEDLKHAGVTTHQHMSSYTTDTLDSYAKLRQAPDAGYEPEGFAGTSSTPSNSGGLSLTPRGEKQQFHSGYDGRRGSVNRVSTVMEGDEDDITSDEDRVLRNQHEHNERMLTPTQEAQRLRGLSPSHTPPHQAATFMPNQFDELTPKRQRSSANTRATARQYLLRPKSRAGRRLQRRLRHPNSVR